MQGLVASADLAAASHQARALVEWWGLAGVDHGTQERPFAWIDAEPAIREPMSPTPVSSAPVITARPPAPAAAALVQTWKECDSWQALMARVRADQPLCPVIDGDPDSGLLLVGESPSVEDLRTGRPFSGPAGAMLDRMLAAIELDRTGCAVMLLSCRRTIAGKPTDADIARDLPLARRLIALIAPRVVVLLGQAATDALADDAARVPIGQRHGQWLTVGGVPALPMFNPAYLLRNPTATVKAAAWADLLSLRKRIHG